MFDLYCAVLIVVTAVGIVGSLMTVLFGFMEDEEEIRRGGVVAFTLTLLLGWAWPLIATVAILGGLGYGLFTTARVIKHHSLDF